MNRERAKELLPIIQAFADGEKIEVSDGIGWLGSATPNWSNNYEYRIKPELEVIYVNKPVGDNHGAGIYKSPEYASLVAKEFGGDYEYVGKEFKEVKE